jgi:hypothetical protein
MSCGEEIVALLRWERTPSSHTTYFNPVIGHSSREQEESTEETGATSPAVTRYPLRNGVDTQG